MSMKSQFSRGPIIPLTPDQVHNLLSALSAGHLRIAEDEEGMPQLTPGWREEEITPKLAAPVRRSGRPSPDLILLILAVRDTASRTPDRLRQLRRLAGTVPASSVLALL